MKKTLTVIYAATLLIIGGENRAKAATYNADQNVFSSAPPAAGIYTSVATPNLAPAGTIIWYVSAGADGVLGTFNNGTPPSMIFDTQVLGGDDVLLGQARVGSEMFGLALGDGSLIETITVDTIHSSRNIFVLAWGSDVDLSNPSGSVPILTPTPGDFFNFVNLGVRLAPAVGNANWDLASPLFSSGITIAVPEPSTLALAGLGLVGLFGYRRFKK